MTLARVAGSVTCTVKHGDYYGLKLLVVQPIRPDGTDDGSEFLAVDGVQAGEGDHVLVIDEGGSARSIVGRPDATTVRAVVGAIVDGINT